MTQASVSTPKTASISTKPRIEPLFNSAFTRIFGQEESKPLTQSLVNAVLQRIGLDPVEEIESIEAEHTATGGSIECKTPRMDVCLVAAGRVIDLEAQGYPEDVGARSLFYAAQLLCENTPAGASYKNLPQVVVITLLDAPSLFPDTVDYVYVSQMQWSGNGEIVADGPNQILLAVIELEKVRRRYNHLTDEILSDELLTWAYLLTQGFDDKAEVEKMMSEIPSIEYFAELYGRAIDDPKVKQAYKDAVSAEREYQSRQDYYERLKREAIEEGTKEGLEQGLKQGLEQGLKQGLEQGLEQGLAQGLEQGAKEGIDAMASKLRELGVDESLIKQAVTEASAKA